MSTRSETALEFERQRGRQWCKINGVTFVGVNEEGVWYSRTIHQIATGQLLPSHGVMPWAEVTRDLNEYYHKFDHLIEEERNAALDRGRPADDV